MSAETRKEAEKKSRSDREKVKQALKIDDKQWRTEQEEFVRTHVPETGVHSSLDSESPSPPQRKALGRISSAQRPSATFISFTRAVAYYFFRKDNKDEKSELGFERHHLAAS